MITYEDAAKKFEGETMEIVPTAKKRICIPVMRDFPDAEKVEFKSWDGSMQEDVGYKFFNKADKSDQVISANEGIIICGEKELPGGKMLSEDLQEYISKHPSSVRTAGGIKDLIEHMKTLAINADGDYDIYTSNYKFLAEKIAGGPAKEEIKPGKVYVGPKKADTLQAYRVGPGVEFEGAPGTASTQVAGKDGAYIIKEKDNMRMIQANVFKESYSIVKQPKVSGKENVNEG